MMEIKAKEIQKELSKLTSLKGRTPNSSGEELSKAFATLASFDTGGVFTGSFSGIGAWERHIVGDELVHILEGSTELTILTEEDRQIFNLKAGMVMVVPKGLWHRFNAKNSVTLLAVTPHPTEHSLNDDPRIIE
ncbi:MAG: cupin domain-containing protein [Emcibacteraceae bacterium]|nr:cupin domain-containing protein [Emcibacteraceae bacterium]